MDELTRLFKQGYEDYKEFQHLLELATDYDQFVSTYKGFNRGRNYTDFNFKSITVTVYDIDRTLCDIFVIWDNNDFYEVDITDWE